MPTLTTAISGGSRAGSWFRRACLFLALPVLGLALGCSKIASSDATAPTITSFSPIYAAGASGTLVTVTGAGFTGASAVTVCGVTVPSNLNGNYPNNLILSDTEITFNLPAVTTTGPITVTGARGGTATSGSDFEVQPTVISNGISPFTGPQGTSVTITGNGMLGVTGVTFGGITAPINTTTEPATATTITVTAPAGLAIGVPATVILSNGYGIGSTTASSQFTETSGSGSGTITSFSPENAVTGTQVGILGSEFTHILSVSFGGVPALSINGVNASQVNVIVPDMAVSGPITVVADGGTMVSSELFVVVPAFGSGQPSAGVLQFPVVITGSGLMGVTGITVGGVLVAPTAQTASSITFTIPANATTGPGTLYLQNDYGLTPASIPFTVEIAI